MEFVDLLRAGWLVAVTVLAYAAVVFRRIVLRQAHPLDWPVDLEMIAAGFKVGIKYGNLATLRLMLSFMAHPWLYLGLKVQRVQPPGCEPAYWLSLRGVEPPSGDAPHLSTSSSSSGDEDRPAPRARQQPDVVLCYVHGGAFVSGHPLMCSSTFQRWMRALARQGISSRVLCIQYPLAPERPFPAAVASTAAVFAWVGQQFPAGCGTTLVAVGDSAGGNIVPTSLAALRDYVQRQQQVAVAAAAEQGAQPATHSIADAVQASIAASSADGGSSSEPRQGVLAPAGEAGNATSSSGSQTSALTAAIEAHLFADLHNRLTVMAAKSTGSANTNSNSSSNSSAGLLTAVRMPDSIVLVSPCTDISPACFRTRKLPHLQAAAAAAPGAASGSSSTSLNTTEPQPLPPSCNTNGSGSGGVTDAASGTTTHSSSSSSRGTTHWDYLPENLESGGIGSYAEHHEQLCGVYASPVHLPSVEGLCGGRWMLLGGGVELLYPDIERFAKKLQRSLGEARVVFHVEPRLPHSWPMLPTPSLAARQEVVVSFIAAEHAAAVAAAPTDPAEAQAAGLLCCG